MLVKCVAKLWNNLFSLLRRLSGHSFFAELLNAGFGMARHVCTVQDNKARFTYTKSCILLAPTPDDH